MGASFRNRFFLDIRKDIKLERSEFIARLEGLDRIQVRAEEFADISKENWKLFKEIYAIRPNIPFRIFAGINFDISKIIHFDFLQNITIEISGNIKNLKLLKSFPELTSLSIISDKIDDLEFLKSLNNLKEFRLSQSSKRTKNIDLFPISHLKDLTLLSLSGYDKNLMNLFNNLNKLETLHLKSISSVKSLDFISHIQTLKKIIIQLGGIYELSTLEKLKNVQYLQLWRINKLEDISFISNMTNLQFINLETLNKIEKFPSIINLTKLRRILVASCKNMIDFKALNSSKSLEDFIYQNAKNQQVSDFLPVITNPQIRNIGIGFPRVSEQKIIERLFSENQKSGMTHQYPSFKEEFIYAE
ncbi:leucine-rich repeat domain-containing protein [Maribacter thermophilus]|uniref:leucine-rich repeat domain-containing protein n=1 Tax=Maribacter thermophilus TaxID=1197874 RepID=UPI0006414830|nr:leucine-rich repeat domain-containing protein [Maribacter thermophilus]